MSKAIHFLLFGRGSVRFMVDILIFREKGEATEPRTERQDQFIW